MKKTKIITTAVLACVAASVFAGCNNGGSTGESAEVTRIEGGQTQIAVESSAVDANTEVKGYSFERNGYKVGIGSTEEVVLAAMGEPEDIEDVANCATGGLGSNYLYFDNRVEIQIPANSNGVAQIIIQDPVIDCGGVSVGDTADKVKATYGEANDESEYILQYKKDGMILQFDLEGGKVVSIEFLTDFAAG